MNADTMLRLLLRNKSDKKVVPFENDNVEVELVVDQEVLRERGKCYTPESNIVTVCLPGYVGLYRYIDNEVKNEWEFVPDVRQNPNAKKPSHASRMFQKLTTKVSREIASSTLYVALATAPCNDYNGQGRAGGDLICLEEGGPATSTSFAALGGGTISKIPSIPATSRPTLSSQDQLDGYIQSMSAADGEFIPRRSWEKVDLSKVGAFCDFKACLHV